MKAKKWNIVVITGTVLILGCLIAATIIIDPFLHYHAPLSGLEYPLKDERYQNDGMARHYDYDALITGTSMTQNFKCSEFDELWGANSLKTSYSGASYHELNECIRRALRYNSEVKYVLCSLDGNKLIYPADADEYDDYPEYLYDNNPFNDAEYLLNKEVVPKTLAVINYTRAGEQTVTRDAYGSWGQFKTYGRDAVLSTFSLQQVREETVELTEADITTIQENVTQNFLATALANPETEFYLFFPPYSICYWEALQRTGQLEAQIQAQEIAVELLLTAENINVYDFNDRIDITTNLDNYCDTLHYGEWINSEILSLMAEGKNKLTLDNYKEYYQSVCDIYMLYDYTAY